ncbi:MAG: SRPBCC family protein [Chloroflexi bacterium]|nr:SRPBCC family protein [Chloroflexota bacterium]
MRFNATATINEPTEEVFAVLSDLATWLPKADPDVVSIANTGDGSVKVGTTWKEVLKVPGSTIEIDLETTQLDPNKSFGVKFTTSAMRGEAEWAFHSSGDDTSVSLSIHATSRPIMGWLMYPMIRMDFSKREKSRLANVKHLIESGDLTVPTA